VSFTLYNEAYLKLTSYYADMSHQDKGNPYLKNIVENHLGWMERETELILKEIERHIGEPVVVNTFGYDITGKFMGVDNSQHYGIGNVTLTDYSIKPRDQKEGLDIEPFKKSGLRSLIVRGSEIHTIKFGLEEKK
jgi:small nuclear ribonucleoprotein (snRNP)-like protein